MYLDEESPARGPALVLDGDAWPDAINLALPRHRPYQVSRWTRSGAKCIFDVALAILMLPVLLPLMLLVAVAIRCAEQGPVLFRQTRVGRYGRPFTLFKFRTMTHCDDSRETITTINSYQITPLGRVLRYWKLDELPQLFNVIRADMSFVGPRPKVPEQQVRPLVCRPGITGAASLAFADEESTLARIPRHQLNQYYKDVILPIKDRLDAEYMARATLLTDLKILLKTGFRRWAKYSVEEMHTGQTIPQARIKR